VNVKDKELTVWKCHNGDEEPEYGSKNKGKDKRKRKA